MFSMSQLQWYGYYKSYLAVDNLLHYLCDQARPAGSILGTLITIHRDGMNVQAPIVFRAALYLTSNYNQLNVCPNPLLVCYKIARDMDHKVGAHYTQG